jgi:hypothetical protein
MEYQQEKNIFPGLNILKIGAYLPGFQGFLPGYLIGQSWYNLWG